MTRRACGPLLALLACLAADEARAQCTRDIDCKGNRICQQGACVDAAAPPAAPPASTQQPPPVTQPGPVAQPPRTDHYFRRAYGSVGALLVPHTWWGAFNDGTADQGFQAGVHVSGLAVLSPRAHLGGYVSWHDLPQLDDRHLVGLGLAVKAGGMIGDRVWLGFALDFGLLILAGEPRTLYGLQLFPRLQVEVAAVDVGGFRMAPFAAVGSMGMPVGDIGPDWLGWSVAAQLLFGVSFGS